jgi:DNA mismatch repair protein MutS
MANILNDYLQYFEKYVQQYGRERLVVVMQVGAFYEMYATTTHGPDIQKVSSLLNIVCTRKDKNVHKISNKNPYLAGFPLQTLQKFIQILMNNGYTVIVVEQVTPPPEPKRDVTGIYSPGTYIEQMSSPDANNVVCVYVEYEQQLSGIWLPCIGLSSADLSTGHCMVYEACSTKSDIMYAIDEAYRFLISSNPKEIVFYYKGNKSMIPVEKVFTLLDIDMGKLFYKGEPNAVMTKIAYQNEVLSKVYKTGGMSALEDLNLSKEIYATQSFILLLNYAHEHNEKIITNILVPTHFMSEYHLMLGNDAVRQLNILESDYFDGPNKRIKSLFDVVNNTNTAMGRRYLRDRLVAPLLIPKELNKNYDDVSIVLKEGNYKQIKTFLKEICDIERLERKLSLQILHMHELSSLYESYDTIINLVDFMKKDNDLKKLLPVNKILQKQIQFIKYIDTIFNKDQLKIQNLSAIVHSIFNEGVYPEIDEIQKKINSGMNFMNDLCNVLSEVINDKIHLKQNTRDGHYLSLTKIRSLRLKEYFKTHPIIDIHSYELDTSKLIFKAGSATTIKIFFSDMSQQSNELNEYREKLGEIVKATYLNELNEIYTKYSDVFLAMNNFISYTDFITSNAETAVLYNYVRPTIEQQEQQEQSDNPNTTDSYIESEQIRHPIIERIIDYEYVPHDISLGKELKGMLVYGLNSAGKSSYMKAVGLNLIMAQSGMFVSAKSFKYIPYKTCFARITGNDNIFKGQSSFTLEMSELDCILERSGRNTLVIGDEVCRGTEHVSSNAIVASAIVHLASSNTSFIFATHLHELSTIDEVINLENVKMFNIAIDYDEKNDEIIYSRKMQEGPGEPVYGAMVARHIIKNKSFNEMVNKIKNDLLKRYSEIVPLKKSRYHSEVFMIECEICHKKNVKGKRSELETHHINPQKDCQNGFVKSKPHLAMNSKANICNVCEECHVDHHTNKITIEGYVKTSKGKKLKVSKILIDEDN